MLGPVRGPLVVQDAAHEQGVGDGEAGADGGSHLVIEIWKCHVSGASTTPSREMKKFDLILRTSWPL